MSEHAMTDRAERQTAEPQKYEAPALVLIGPLDRVTLGSFGTQGDSGGTKKVK
jgi:hypothetical protein